MAPLAAVPPPPPPEVRIMARADDMGGGGKARPDASQVTQDVATSDATGANGAKADARV